MAEMHLLMKYFTYFDGSKTWDEIQPIVDETLHKDFVIVDGRQKQNKEEFTLKLKEFVDDGGWMEIIKIEVIPEKKGICYEIGFHRPNDAKNPLTMTKSFGQFSPDDNKLIGVKRDNVRNVFQML